MKARPDFTEFEYTGKTINGDYINLANVQRAAEHRTRYVVDSDASQQLSVFVTTPTPRSNTVASEIIVRSTAFSDDNGRPESALFDSFVSEATGRKVYAVNAPGVDYWQKDEDHKERQELTPDQFEDLYYRGKFAKVGAASMLALVNAAIMDGVKHPKFILSASSMGVAITAGMIRTALDKNIDVAGIVLAEPVNHMTRSPLTIAKQFAFSNAKAGEYVALNPDEITDKSESFGFWAKRVLEAKMANLAYGMAMGSGTLRSDLGPVDGLADLKTPLYVTRGSGSNLSGGFTAEEYREFVDSLKTTNVEEKTFGGHDHPYTMTVQSVIDGVANVTSR